MPLSEHEKRLLDEIEQTLLIDDPALASSLRTARPQTRARTYIALAFVSLSIGFAMLISGLRLHGFVATILGVAGFVLIVAGTDAAIRVGQRARALRRNSNGSSGSSRVVGPTN
jgi:hypothetical protein